MPKPLSDWFRRSKRQVLVGSRQIGRRAARVLGPASQAAVRILKDRLTLGFDARLILGIIMLAGVTLMTTALQHWTSAGLQHQVQRVRLSEDVLAAYQQLKSDVLELFRQSSLAMARDGHAHAEREAELISALRMDLSVIRKLIAQEVALVGVEETEELEALAKIESMLLATLNEYPTAGMESPGERRAFALVRLNLLLDGSNGPNLLALLDSQIAHEKSETAEAHEEFSAVQKMANLTASLASLAIVLLAIGASKMLHFGVRVPMRKLSDATEAIKKGDLEHRINVPGNDGFGAIASSFNRMAEELHRNREGLRQINTQLEETVADRTAELSSANERLTHVDASRRRFIADLSHELRTPLTIIRGEAEVALRGKQKSIADYEHALRRIVEQVSHTSTLVDDLLFMARREAGNTRLKEQAIPIVGFVTKVAQECAVFGEPNNVAITIRSRITETTVMGDENRLRQLIIILLDNAVRYSRPNGLISVDISSQRAAVNIDVVDRGIGIAADELPFVFERYYRGENAAAHDTRGSGLGLPLAKAIVEAHGGAIDVASTLGEGTKVSVLLPGSRKIRAI